MTSIEGKAGKGIERWTLGGEQRAGETQQRTPKREKGGGEGEGQPQKAQGKAEKMPGQQEPARLAERGKSQQPEPQSPRAQMAATAAGPGAAMVTPGEVSSCPLTFQSPVPALHNLPKDALLPPFWNQGSPRSPPPQDPVPKITFPLALGNHFSGVGLGR